jgi:hypothetical protein
MSRATRARTEILGVQVDRAAALPPATGVSEDLFSVTGQVLVTSFWGYVTVAIPNVSLDWDLALDPDDGGSDVALASLLLVDNTAVGTFFVLNATLGSALVAVVDSGFGVVLPKPLHCDAGDIKLNVAGGGAVGTTARVKWGLTYVPLSSDGAVVAV